jgi:hypothetical protein
LFCQNLGRKALVPPARARGCYDRQKKYEKREREERDREIER